MADSPRDVYQPNPEVAARSQIGSMEEYQRLYNLQFHAHESTIAGAV